MNTDEGNLLPSDAMADLKAVLDALGAGTPLDPEIACRVRERSERIRQDVFERHGVLNIAVDLIRECRGELEESVARARRCLQFDNFVTCEDNPGVWTPSSFLTK